MNTSTWNVLRTVEAQRARINPDCALCCVCVWTLLKGYVTHARTHEGKYRIHAHRITPKCAPQSRSRPATTRMYIRSWNLLSDTRSAQTYIHIHKSIDGIYTSHHSGRASIIPTAQNIWSYTQSLHKRAHTRIYAYTYTHRIQAIAICARTYPKNTRRSVQ